MTDAPPKPLSRTLKPGALEDNAASNNMKASSARLNAVQALYQMRKNDAKVSEVIEQFLYSPVKDTDDDALPEMAPPDGALFKAIVNGVTERKVELEAILKAHRLQGRDEQEIKPLDDVLHVILCAGIYELLVHETIDAPIIINDYLNVTHAFFEKREASLVNGILDQAKSVFRG